MADRPVFLISGGPSTRSLWVPLAERYDLAFLYAQAGQDAHDAGLPAAPMAQLMDGELSEKVDNTAVLMAAALVGHLPELHERFAQAYQGLFNGQTPARLDGGVSGWMAGFAHHMLRGEVAILAQLEKLSSQGATIAGCLTHEDVAADTRALVGWCNARGIPTIHVPHAPCHLLPGVQDIHRETRAVYIAASGPQMARFYAESGHDPAAIRMTGAPHWDDLYHGALPERAESRTVIGIPADQVGPVLCYMSTWGQTTSIRSEFEREFEQGWAATLAAAKQMDAYLMVLVHWNDGRPETEQYYAEQLEAAGVAGLVTRSHKSYLLRAADLLIAQGPSNMCLDAAIMGTPSVYLQTPDFDYATALPRRAGPDNIAREITWALENPAPASAWDEFVGLYNSSHPDGDATERVLAWVDELCGEIAYDPR